MTTGHPSAERRCCRHRRHRPYRRRRAVDAECAPMSDAVAADDDDGDGGAADDDGDDADCPVRRLPRTWLPPVLVAVGQWPIPRSRTRRELRRWRSADGR